MKTFEQYIRESVDFRLGGKANKGILYRYAPKDRVELKELMKKLIKERGSEGDFNDIDTSKVTDMCYMFYEVVSFNGDISQWDTSNVTDMNHMFFCAHKFNKDISCWDTSNVRDMSDMFVRAESFNQDISSWDVSKVTNNAYMFNFCPIKEEYRPKFK